MKTKLSERLEEHKIPQNLWIYTKNGYKTIPQIILQDLEDIVGEDDKWDKKYPLSIKQDIKSRNRLRQEIRENLRKYCEVEK